MKSTENKRDQKSLNGQNKTKIVFFCISNITFDESLDNYLINIELS